MRFDLVVNTFVKDALLPGALKLHGGGWMWRPLVDIRDCADAMIAAYEAPAEKVRGEIFNVVHSNYQIRELAMIVAGSVQLTGRRGGARGGAGARSSPATTSAPTRSCPRRSASSRGARCSRPSATCWRESTLTTAPCLTDPRGYNIRWLELLHEVKPVVDSFAAVL